MSPRGIEVGFFLGFVTVLLLTGGTAGCSYEDLNESLRTPSPTDTMDVQAAETRNYAVLAWLLGEPMGTVILEDSGPLDGPGRGFGKGADVEAAGQYLVAAACVGASHARMFVTQQDSQTGTRFYEISIDCVRGTHTQVIELQRGYVAAHLLVSGPGATPRTGSVGGLRIFSDDHAA